MDYYFSYFYYLIINLIQPPWKPPQWEEPPGKILLLLLFVMSGMNVLFYVIFEFSDVIIIEKWYLKSFDLKANDNW